MADPLAALRAALALSFGLDDRRLAIALASVGASPPPLRAAGSGSFEPGDDVQRIRALVELAQRGDAEAFGQLYDAYVTPIYRLAYHRLGSRHLAEDLTGDTFVRALRSIGSFTWQGKDFGAWLTTIARNLIADHYRSSRHRLEDVVAAIPEQPGVGPGTEDEVLAGLSNADLMRAVHALAPEQRDCILMRFLEGLSIAETAAALGRSEGAVKQLQLRAMRNLAKSVEQNRMTA